MSEKLTRKEIRKPDKFLEAITEFWNKAAQHQKAIGIGALAVVGLFLIVGLISHSQEKSATAAGGALAQALELSRQGIEGTFDASSDPDAPKFASHQEKYEKLVAAFEKVRADHPGSKAARTAGYYLADAQFQLGKLEEADKAYEQFIAQTSSGDPLRVLALEGRGYIAESKKEWAKASELFGQMSREASGEPTKARAAYHRARILAAEGKKQEAAEAFQKVKSEFKEAPAARLAGERLALLAADGVHAPATEKAEVAEKK
ncbi:MAG: tetratricopeptide repeat protein [Myxococcales bacterium]